MKKCKGDDVIRCFYLLLTNLRPNIVKSYNTIKLTFMNGSFFRIKDYETMKLLLDKYLIIELSAKRSKGKIKKPIVYYLQCLRNMYT